MAECGFCENGEQERLIASGATEIGGTLPVNTDGGCIANGEPIGASGLRQVYEVVQQLRGRVGRTPGPGRTEGRLHPCVRRPGRERLHGAVPLIREGRIRSAGIRDGRFRDGRFRDGGRRGRQ